MTTTTAYDNCVTNHSYNQQNCLSSVQRTRRENLIKLDFGSMTKHEGPMHSNGGDSAGCSIESSPVDSLLDDQGECLIKKIERRCNVRPGRRKRGRKS